MAMTNIDPGTTIAAATHRRPAYATSCPMLTEIMVARGPVAAMYVHAANQ